MWRKFNFTHDVPFLCKSYGEWDKVEVSTFVPISHEGSDEEGEVSEYEMVPENNYINNGYNVVSNDVNSKEEEHFFDQELDESLD